jgi:3D (Asp-Asp-Asp) domain-containing protein
LKSLISLGTSVALAGMVLSSALVAEAAPPVGRSDAKDADGAERDTTAMRQARVAGTGAMGLWVRNGPGQQYPAPVALSEGTRVRVVQGPVLDAEGREWFLVTGYDRQGSRGWSAGEFLLDTGGSDLEIAGVTVVAPHVASAGRSISARLTAYTNQEPGGGAHGTMTKSGTPVRWGVVAVDPQVIPLGSRLLIEGLDGLFVAEDTGGGVRGNHVDVFFPDYASAIHFGVQYRTVTVVP